MSFPFTITANFRKWINLTENQQEKSNGKHNAKVPCLVGEARARYTSFHAARETNVVTFSPGKTRKHVARNICCGHVSSMFPIFATWENVFPVAKYVSAAKQKHTLETMFPVAKLINIQETCVGSKCFWQHVSSFCQGFTTRETLFP